MTKKQTDPHNKYYGLYNGKGEMEVFHFSAFYNEHKLVATFKYGKDALAYVAWMNGLLEGKND